MSIENIEPVAFYGKGIYLTNNATNRSIIGKATKFEKLYTEKQMDQHAEIQAIEFAEYVLYKQLQSIPEVKRKRLVKEYFSEFMEAQNDK